MLTALLVLAIVASSALVFTDRVELLKLAVIIALWAAVVAAFVSFIYRRQSDMDQAKARDLKLVYDLQLDREISARREYELGVESQLRRELSSELRAQSSDEIASLRAELAALRANLEILFDTDLAHRPAIETERTSVHNFPDWSTTSDGGQDRSDRGIGPGRVISSRLIKRCVAVEIGDRKLPYAPWLFLKWVNNLRARRLQLRVNRIDVFDVHRNLLGWACPEADHEARGDC